MVDFAVHSLKYQTTSFILDPLNVWFVLLSLLIVHLCLIYINNERFLADYILHSSLLLLSSLCLVGFFLSTDLLFMFFCFEGTLMPMFLMIGAFGSRDRRVYAAMILFAYTFISSLPMLAAIMYMYVECNTLDIHLLSVYTFTPDAERALCMAFFVTVAAKLPLYPLHIWLPEAHVEAPTTGSVILAALLLKLVGFCSPRHDPSVS